MSPGHHSVATHAGGGGDCTSTASSLGQKPRLPYQVVLQQQQVPGTLSKAVVAVLEAQGTSAHLTTVEDLWSLGPVQLQVDALVHQVVVVASIELGTELSRSQAATLVSVARVRGVTKTRGTCHGITIETDNRRLVELRKTPCLEVVPVTITTALDGLLGTPGTVAAVHHGQFHPLGHHVLQLLRLSLEPLLITLSHVADVRRRLEAM